MKLISLRPPERGWREMNSGKEKLCKGWFENGGSEKIFRRGLENAN